MRAANIKTKILTAALALLALAGVGCSNQWRNANFEIDESELTEYLSGIETSGTGDGDVSTRFFEIFNDPASVVFYAKSGVDFGPVVSVFSISDYSFLGSTFENLYFDDMKQAIVTFVVVERPGGFDCSLLIDVEAKDERGIATDQKFFNCIAASIKDGEFVAELEDSLGTPIGLRSFDVSDGFFKSVIQLQISDFKFGPERPIGKISTLVGFGI